jgi:hypothetical protein
MKIEKIIILPENKNLNSISKFAKFFNNFESSLYDLD